MSKTIDRLQANDRQTVKIIEKHWPKLTNVESKDCNQIIHQICIITKIEQELVKLVLLVICLKIFKKAFIEISIFLL